MNRKRLSGLLREWALPIALGAFAALFLTYCVERADAQEEPGVTIPYSWLQYCAATRDPSCIRALITPRDLALINREVSEAIITREDQGYYDSWTPFPPDRHGDCDDDAATKRLALVALGLDPKAMHFETGEVTEPDGRKVGHIVLVVRLEGRDYVLDRRTPGQIYTPLNRPYAWRPMASEDQASVLWRSQ